MWRSSAGAEERRRVVLDYIGRGYSDKFIALRTGLPTREVEKERRKHGRSRPDTRA